MTRQADDKQLGPFLVNEEEDTCWVRREDSDGPNAAVEAVRERYGLDGEEAPHVDDVKAVCLRPTKPGEEAYDVQGWETIWCAKHHPEAEPYWEVDLDAY